MRLDTSSQERTGGPLEQIATVQKLGNKVVIAEMFAAFPLCVFILPHRIALSPATHDSMSIPQWSTGLGLVMGLTLMMFGWSMVPNSFASVSA